MQVDPQQDSMSQSATKTDQKSKDSLRISEDPNAQELIGKNLHTQETKQSLDDIPQI